jgi:hypothetical protein
MAALRFAKRIDPAPDRPLDADAFGAHTSGAVRSAFVRLGRAGVHLDTPRADTEALLARKLR